MTTNELINNITQTFAEGVLLVERKNADYAGSEDCFRNFRFSAIVGVSPERAILVRVADKLARVSNLLDKESQVKDEHITDTLLDMINYLAILKAMLSEQQS